MSSSYGNLFKITTWGESHGPGVGVVIDGCPSGLEFSLEEIQKDLTRRRPGQSALTTQRQEEDKVEVLSGVFEGKTTGTPISMMVRNKDQKSKDYSEIQEWYRPSHADFTYDAKYGFRDYRGGGRSSARESVGRVAAGALAKIWLKKEFNLEILAYVTKIGTISCEMDPLSASYDDIESSLVRCPDPNTQKEMESAVVKAKKDGDSLGGIIQLVVKNVPAGLGEPIFNRVEAALGYAFLSIPATKGFEIGSGFAGTSLRGSEHNDPFVNNEGRIQTESNNSGGVQGGITNGMPILGKIAFKPTATIAKPQKTVNSEGKEGILKARGRHDPCVLPRAVVIVEAMAAITMLNFALEWRSRKEQ